MSLTTYHHVTFCTDCHCTINYVTLSPISDRQMVCMDCEILTYPEFDEFTTD